MIQVQLENLVVPKWARYGHSQTLWAHFLKSPALQSRGERVEFKLPDGDTLVGRFHAGTSHTDVFLFHGLTGDAEAAYVRRITEICLKRGHSVYRINHRGCGEGYGVARLPYHSGRGEDLSEVLAQVHQARPAQRQIAIGFSLGANALLCLMTGIRGTHQPDAAIAVNPPVDLGSVARSLEMGLNRIYDFQFVNSLRRTLRTMHREGLLDQQFKIGWNTTLRNFDDIYTAPTGGFSSGEDYYATCSTWNRMDQITRPTIVITAKDDPFIKYQAFERAKFSSQVTFRPEPVGGHLGYLSAKKTPLGTNRWLDYAISEYLKALD